MGFAILASFPLGVYRGHLGGEAVDQLPSPARLHAAVLCAAAAGTRAQLVDGRLEPSAEDQTALEWLERNPPTGLVVPEKVLNASDSTAHRRNGLVRKDGGQWNPAKTEERDAVGSVAVGGAFGWVWDPPPPAAVRLALGELCADVPHLGEAESVTVLATGEAEPTLVLDPEADLFGPVGDDLTVAQAGRTAALTEAHKAIAHPIPSNRSDAHRSSEQSLTTPPSTSKTRVARYRAPDAAPAALPWVTAIVIPFEQRWEIAPETRVSWAVAAHRALIGTIGDGAPSVLTGVYASGAPRPANRVAIHVVPRSLRSPGESGSEILVLIPAGVDTTELTIVAAAVQRMSRLRGKSLGSSIFVNAAELWPAVAPGALRVWRADPVAVPDTRPVRGGPWTAQDAALLSVGLVHRDLWELRGRGDRWFREVAAVAAGRGFEVLHAQRAPGLDVGRFVHTVPRGHLVQPYSLWMRTPTHPRAALALGQSRHLGGGLLIPHDLPQSEIRA
jgi:CRISPR-associated protein Csb2